MMKEKIEIPSVSCTSSEWLGSIHSLPLKMALDIYKSLNDSGFLRTAFGARVFSKMYFTYKSFLGDSFKSLVQQRPYLFAGGHIIDIGANIGYTPSLFYKVLSPNFKLFAFEPESVNYGELVKQIKNFHGVGRVIPIQCALGKAPRSGGLLWRNPNNHADHRIIEEDRLHLEGDAEFERVRLDSLDNFLHTQKRENEPISFIKIDVQGYEEQVIRGMSETLLRNPRAVLAVEYCPHSLKQLGFDPNGLLSLIKSNGYGIKVLRRNGSVSEFSPNFSDSGSSVEYIDLLCQKPNASGSP